MKKLLLISFILFSCGSNGTKKNVEKSLKMENYTMVDSADYIEHLNEVGRFYINNNEVKIIKLSISSQKYLDELGNKIVQNNELFFKQNKKNQIKLVKSSEPFYFSLPNRKIFISTGLISRFIKHEGLLASIISYELVRSERNIYPTKLTIPTGTIDDSKLIEMLRLPLKMKVEVHKWGFHILKRAGYDYDHYLGWIQIMNRNNKDFIIMKNDLRQIAREEALFKSFMIKQAGQLKETRRFNSSKSFYKFIKEVSRTKV
jgi:hypothetical protein